MTALESYYNKFNEEHRLQTRHGQVEFFVTMEYIHRIIADKLATDGGNGRALKILDLGAATGAYSVPLSREGFDLTAVELVKKNIALLRSKHEHVKCWQGDARDLHFLDDAAFDITLIFGPLYHLISFEDKLKVFSEARRVTKKCGVIFAAYTMNEYSILKYCFEENRIKNLIDTGRVDSAFRTKPASGDLYSYVRIEDIDALNERSGLERIKIFSPDGPSDYMRRELNAMDGETFELYKKYVLSVSDRPELLGAGSHLVDVLRN